ncbi:AMP-binding protein [Spirillospora sp. CA-108201]
MPNVAQAAWEHARTHPDRIALRGTAGAWTYGVLRERSAVYTGALVAAGVRPGDRVLLCAPSVPEFVAVYLAVQAAGAIVVTVNTMATRPEIEYMLKDAGCRLAVGWHGNGPAAADAAAAAGVPLWTLEPGAQATGGTAINRVHQASHDDTAAILYTSGTTGRPKGAQLTTGNLLACAETFTAALELTSEDRSGTALPLYHVFGQAVVMGSALRAGAAVSLLPRFEAEAMLAMLRDDRLTVMFGVPTMWNAMLHASEGADAVGFADLRLAASGGAPLPAEVLRAFTVRFGCVILEGYGLTETTGVATFNGLRRRRKPGFVGPALDGCELEIRRPVGTVCRPDEVGEIFLRGPAVMKGYWNRPEETAAALKDGWLKTGDLGARDAAGDVRIVDRLKDLIIRGGYNVYPGEVEEVLYTHPDIVDAAVIGVPDDHYGEEVAAVIVLRPGARMDAAGLRVWAKEKLSAYKVPRLVGFVAALPKGPSGKVLKRAIDRDSLRAPATVRTGS